VLQATVDKVAALFSHFVWDLRPLMVRQFSLKCHMYVAFAVEAFAPRILSGEHLDDEAAKGPNVRALAHFLDMRLWRHPRR